MSTEELADKMRDEEYLRSRGFEKKRCKTCYGLGRITSAAEPIGHHCYACDGRGYTWQALMR